jgi:AcrR family transcriptional regulator
MKPAPRFKREGAGLWIEAAYAVLAQEGHASLTIERLTTLTGKTRGSFYHHFGSLDGFITRFLDDWREQNTERIIRLAEADPEPSRRRAVVHREAVRADTRIEIAIRRWAGADGKVLAACHEVDRRRIDVLRRDVVALAEARGSELGADEAERLAWFEYAAFVGGQMLAPEGKLDALPDIGSLYDDMLDAFLGRR